MTKKNRIQKIKVILISAVTFVFAMGTAVFSPATSSAYAPTIRQGTTSTYGVLAGSTVTNTGNTSISGSAGGDLGLHPGTSYTGNSTVTLSGTVHLTDTAAATAKADLEVAYLDLGADTATASTIGVELGGQTLLPGSYKTAAGTFGNTGNLILDGAGDANSKFIFLAASTVVTSDPSTMTLTNGAQACNVYWQVGSSATIDGNFVGHVYAYADITAVSSARIDGQLLARTGAVTLDTNTIVNSACSTPVVVPTQSTPRDVPAVPQNSSVTSVSTSVCTTTEDYTVNIGGNFPKDILNIAVNGRNIPLSRWNQTPTNVSVNLPASETKSFTIDIYNRLLPMIPTQVFICSEAVDVPAVDTPTETGGELPTTASNGYNFLIGAAGVGVLGAGAYFLRRRSQK